MYTSAKTLMTVSLFDTSEYTASFLYLCLLLLLARCSYWLFVCICFVYVFVCLLFVVCCVFYVGACGLGRHGLHDEVPPQLPLAEPSIYIYIYIYIYMF